MNVTYHGNLDIAKLLLQYGADTNAKNTKSKLTNNFIIYLLIRNNLRFHTLIYNYCYSFYKNIKHIYQ